MTGELVHSTTDGGIAVITLDSPRNRNALSRQLCRELVVALQEASESNEVRVIVLAHAGPAFCAGRDIKEPPIRPTEPVGPGLAEILELMWTSPKPIVARIDGAVRAGGVGLAAACDTVVASSTSTFGLPEVRIGVVPAVISAVVLARVAAAAAHELLLTGDVLDAARCAEIGLVNRVASPDLLDEAIEQVTSSLLAGTPAAIAATKLLSRSATIPDLGSRLVPLKAQSASFFNVMPARPSALTPEDRP